MDYSEYMQRIIDACVNTWQPYIEELIVSMPDWLAPALGIFGAITVVVTIYKLIHLVCDYIGIYGDMKHDREMGILG